MFFLTHGVVCYAPALVNGVSIDYTYFVVSGQINIIGLRSPNVKWFSKCDNSPLMACLVVNCRQPGFPTGSPVGGSRIWNDLPADVTFADLC